MFRRKHPTEPGTAPDTAPPAARTKRNWNWLRISMLCNVVLVAGWLAMESGRYVVHLSDTNPGLCATCHVMRSHVNSYENGINLDNLHRKANVGCKDCHDYPISAELASAVAFVLGNYTVNPQGELFKREVDDSMCFKCHLSYEHVSYRTGMLSGRNPHNSHWGPLPCRTCHTSHGPQIDYCASCHDHGNQRMTGESVLPDPLPVLTNDVRPPGK